MAELNKGIIQSKFIKTDDGYVKELIPASDILLEDGKTTVEKRLSVIDYIIERGSGILAEGTEGTYEKWASGKLVQRLRVTKTGISIAQDYSPPSYPNSLFVGTYSWKLPVSFYNINYCNCSMFKYSTGASWGSIAGFTNSTIQFYGYDTYKRDGSTTCVIEGYAEGTWKQII